MIADAVVHAARDTLRRFDLPEDFLTRQEIEGAWRGLYDQSLPPDVLDPENPPFSTEIHLIAERMLHTLERRLT